MNYSFPKTLKGKLTILTVSITLIITILMGSISFYISQTFLEKNLIQTTEYTLQLVMDSITTDINELIYFTKWCGSNKSIMDYLESNPTDKDFTQIQLEAFERLKEEYQNSKISEYIKRIVICDNEDNYIQLIGKAYDLYEPSPNKIKELSFYKELLNASTFRWIGFVEDPLVKNTSEEVIPIIRPIYSSYNSTQIGWAYITVSKYMITDQLDSYTIPNDSDVVITIEEDPLQDAIYNRDTELDSFLHTASKKDVDSSILHLYSIYNDTITKLDSSYEVVKNLTNVVSNNRTSASVIQDSNQKKHTVVTYQSKLNGWSLSQSLSKEHTKLQKRLYHILILISCLVILFLGTTLLFYLNRYINTPIRMIRENIKRISMGDFTLNTTIEWDNEFGEIGRCINSLTYDIENLMEKRITDEKQKHQLEYEILLSQINPHFLYNTLNSIKWMATIQNATGIAEMTTSLARLLKKVTKEANPFVTIQEELSILDDYFTIQKYRYGGTITLVKYVEHESLYSNYVPKFTLQPLIENAIFHGIEPKGEPGNITISIKQLDKYRILIEVVDDGVGMTEEQINSILEGKEEDTPSFFRKIGIHNVNKRIQYTFGSTFGMSIESELHNYTKMSIRIPLIIEETLEYY